MGPRAGRRRWTAGPAGCASRPRARWPNGAPRAVRLPLIWPENFPANTRHALRAASYAAEQGAGARFALAASRLAFCGGFDLEDTEILSVAASVAGLPVDGCLEAARDPSRDVDAVGHRARPARPRGAPPAGGPARPALARGGAPPRTRRAAARPRPLTPGSAIPPPPSRAAPAPSPAAPLPPSCNGGGPASILTRWGNFQHSSRRSPLIQDFAPSRREILLPAVVRPGNAGICPSGPSCRRGQPAPPRGRRC